MKQKYFSVFLVLSIFFSLIFNLIIVGNKQKLQKNEIPMRQAGNNSSGFVSPTVFLGNIIEIEQLFKINSGENLVFNKQKENVEIFDSGQLDLKNYISSLSEHVYLQIIVYKYHKEAKFNSAYEGNEWIVDLDKWKQWLQGLNVGENKVNTICNDWGCNKLDFSQPVLMKKINLNKYFVGDGYFKPGLMFSRNYTCFNSINNTIMDVRLDYYINKDSAEMKEIFFKIEKLLP